MTEHEIVWEETQDGQELIRLMGERADILWSMDHTWAASAWIVIALVALACILLFGLAILMEVQLGRGVPRAKRAEGVAFIAASAAIIALLVFGLHAWTEITLPRDLAVVEARIDAILMRHPDWGVVL